MVDRAGKVYGRLTAIKRADHIPGGFRTYAHWWCECSCERACVVVASNSLSRGHTRSCGCLVTESRRRIRDSLVGKQFGRLTVIKPSAITYGKGVYWWCECQCGNACKLVSRSSLLNGSAKSCGCLAEIANRNRNRTHGMTGTPEWAAWQTMRQRCNNPAHKQYAHYGGRGISVCESWNTSFDAFLQDMGLRPGPDYSIDRLENDGNYEPANCAWRTAQDQMNNRRTTVLLCFRGQTKPLAHWAAVMGIKHSILYRRIRDGWGTARALTTPAAKRTKK
jgi:hypothetical protein